jgi:chitinase
VACSATDGGAGVRSVQVQVAPNAGDGASYTTVCTATTAPYSCSWATAGLADGPYKVRAIATDKADNADTSAVVSSRVVDNTAPLATLNDPGATLAAGDVALSATATDATSGVARVTFQRAAAGTTTWTDVCTATSAPYGCTWAATAGTYDLRAVVIDAAGNTATTPALRRQVVADTVKPAGASLRTVNAPGGTAGRLDTGDQLVLRYTEPMLLSSIVKGWTGGTSAAFTVTVGAGGWFGSTDDALSFAASGTGPTPNLGTVGLGSGGWVTILDSLRFAATATAATVNGATEVTITLGAKSGSGNTTAVGGVRLDWAPSAAATDLAGNTATTTAVTQPAAGAAF